MSENKIQRRKIHTPGHTVNCICLGIMAVLFFAFSAFNLFQFNRPTVSESEKRTLASFPSFSFEALFDGSYFSGIDDFLSDTFLGREYMVKSASKLQTLKGFEMKLDGQSYVVIDNTPEQTEAETTVDRSAFDITIPVITTQSPETSVNPDVTSENQNPESSGSPDNPGTDAPDDTTAATDPPETTEGLTFRYISLKLSDSSLTLEEEQMSIISALLSTSGVGNADEIQWTVSDSTVLSLSGNGNTATCLALKAGSCRVTASSGPLYAECSVTVTKKTQQQQMIQEITGTIFKYGDRYYQRIPYGGDSLKEVSEDYSKLCLYYAAMFPGTQISFLPSPHATLLLDTSKVTQAGRDQGLILSEMAQYYDSSVNFVNVYPAMKAHDSEYLYFKTDHHWTSLGAYYAYSEFAKSRGFTPTPLSSFKYKYVRNDLAGSYVNELSAKINITERDTFEFYITNKKHKMTITYSPSDVKKYDVSPTATYNTCIMDGFWPSYTAFLSGDRPMVTINVPENSAANGGSGKSILVIKDSYGSAFVPYLCEHYENIVAVDPRYFSLCFSKTVQDQLSAYKFDDVLITVNIQMANSYTWLKMFYSLVGVKIN